jgi:thiol-disulfide isomerase/thioredoxin
MEAIFYVQDANIDSVFDLDTQSKAYTQDVINKTKQIDEYLKTGTILSENAKQFLSNNLKLFYLNNSLLDLDPTGKFPNILDKLEKSFYSCLSYFDLNNPQYLYCDYYYFVLQSILDNQILNIPRIGDTSVQDWMKEVKAIMADLIGSNTGLFYDLLAASAYSKQFIDETKPLSETQIKNIKSYFKNKSFVDILLTENEKIAKVTGITSHLQINETPAVPKEKVLDAIVAKYKGKVVMVDFWATWCGPCLAAMKESREFKKEMSDKDVVFVYITNRSSPKELWEKKIQGIGGEHYYLNNDGEWDSISLSDKYGFNGIPTYLIFDTTGELKHRRIAYPGNDEIREMVEDLLP